MPIQVQVGPPVITINQGRKFMVTKSDGSIDAESELGMFADDTRFVSTYEISLNHRSWILLTSQSPAYYSAQHTFQNPPIRTQDGAISGGDLGLTLTRTIAGAVHEDFDIRNYSGKTVRFYFAVRLESDFADIFDVKGHRLLRRGLIRSSWDDERSELVNDYENGDFHRRFRYRVEKADSIPHYSNGQIAFEVKIDAGGAWHACGILAPDTAETESPKPWLLPCRAVNYLDHAENQSHSRWLESATRISSPNPDVVRAFAQSVDDMGALRLHGEDLGADVWVAAAGVPWFVTFFGRDSLVASLQNMIIQPRFALGALEKLGEYQASERDDWRDAQPGKILHEIRFGELAHFNLIPHTPYYGTADATILYPIVLHEAWKWLGDVELLKRYRGIAERCLEWIDRFGDLDGDGFQEYKTFSTLGYDNMAWKDGGDSILYPDGSQVRQPKALCELQGYVYDAWLRMAEIFDVLGERARGVELRERAAILKRQFNQSFWIEDLGFYALTLDPDKEPVASVASNPGHCLWSGIVDESRAERVVSRLLAPDMFSQWGIRTLSADHAAYNPHSYQRGSVWPHDNAIIAAGMKRYGYHDEVNQVARAIFDAASAFLGYRLPELFAGLERGDEHFPVQYLGANVPQAWAAGSIFMLLQSILGIRADAPNRRLYVDPVLPDWLPEITLTNLRIGESRLDLRFWRDDDATTFEPLNSDGSIEVVSIPATSAHSTLR